MYKEKTLDQYQDNYLCILLSNKVKLDDFNIKYRFSNIKNNENIIYLELIIHFNNYLIPILIYNHIELNKTYAHIYTHIDNIELDIKISDVYNKKLNEDLFTKMLSNIIIKLKNKKYFSDIKIEEYNNNFNKSEKPTCEINILQKSIDKLLKQDPDNYTNNSLNYFSYASGNLKADIEVLCKLKENNYTFNNLLFNDTMYNLDIIYNNYYLHKNNKFEYPKYFLEEYLRKILNLDNTNIYFTTNIKNAMEISERYNIIFNYCITIQPQSNDINFKQFYDIYCINHYKTIWCDNISNNGKMANLFINEHDIKKPTIMISEESNTPTKKNFKYINRINKELEELSSFDYLTIENKLELNNSINITINNDKLTNDNKIDKIHFI